PSHSTKLRASCRCDKSPCRDTLAARRVPVDAPYTFLSFRCTAPQNSHIPAGHFAAVRASSRCANRPQDFRGSPFYLLIQKGDEKSPASITRGRAIVSNRGVRKV